MRQQQRRRRRHDRCHCHLLSSFIPVTGEGRSLWDKGRAGEGERIIDLKKDRERRVSKTAYDIKRKKIP
jgi:hypothetical protein